jgi:ABC-type antimicrobial peptide transport system permease subunit
VVKDFQYGSIHQRVEPLIFRFRSALAGRNTMVKIKAGTERVTIEQIEKLYKEFHPKYPFEFSFLDDDYQALYEAESRVAASSKYFTAIAIIISCLGLFGLAAFTAERRIKEIGIRKVMGASEFGILRLLSADFTEMVLMAIFIALPISYVIVKKWLNDFAYRIELEWWLFVGAALAALVIAWITIGLQTVRAARINPARTLKIE